MNIVIVVIIELNYLYIVVTSAQLGASIASAMAMNPTY